jgi:hypothetical protein
MSDWFKSCIYKNNNNIKKTKENEFSLENFRCLIENDVVS